MGKMVRAAAGAGAAQKWTGSATLVKTWFKNLLKTISIY
jgi:hypothetical protein